MERRELAGTPDGVSVITLGTMLFGRPVPSAGGHRAGPRRPRPGRQPVRHRRHLRGLRPLSGLARRGRRDDPGRGAARAARPGVHHHQGGQPGGQRAGRRPSGRRRLRGDRSERRTTSSSRSTPASGACAPTTWTTTCLHIADADTPLEDTLGAVDRLVRAGKVRHWGFSNFDAAPDRSHARPVPGRRGAAAGGGAALLQLAGTGRGVRLPAGLPAGGHRDHPVPAAGRRPAERQVPSRRTPPAGSRASESAWIDAAEIPHERLRPFDEEAAAAGVAPACYAVRWLLARDGVVSVVTGVKSAIQLEELANCAGNAAS